MTATDRQYLNSLIAARNRTAAQLADLSSQLTPDVSLDGQSVSYTSAISALTQRLKELNELIQLAQSPFWVVSKARA